MEATRFYDLHSEGSAKESFEICYINAPKDEAIRIFKKRFKHHPGNITCECCGEDYSVSSVSDIEESILTDRISRNEILIIK